MTSLDGREFAVDMLSIWGEANDDVKPLVEKRSWGITVIAQTLCNAARKQVLETLGSPKCSSDSCYQIEGLDFEYPANALS